MGNQQSQSELCEIEPIIDYLDWIPSYTDFSIKHIPDNYYKEEEREYILFSCRRVGNNSLF